MKGRRIGLTLASIHTGASESLWSSIADMTKGTDDQLFIFPLGRLECEEESEAMRAAVVPLVNSKNIDGLISWASSLGGVVSLSEVVAFHQEHFSDIPYVTIGLKIDGHAEISFDAYSGFKSGVMHLIRTHGERKIAFIRGPVNHVSAEDRYSAYLDSLRESGIAIDENLISSPVPWNNGEDAVRELVEGRGLKPGEDFTALCSASDLMMLGAGRYLERMGIRIPNEVKLFGFNNSPESQLLRVPCTTAAMPHERMGIMSYTLIKGLINSPAGDFECPDLILPADLVVRKSCGCTDSLAGLDASSVIHNKEAFFAWANKVFIYTEKEKEIAQNLRSLAFAFPLTEEQQDTLLYETAKLFESLLERNIDVTLIYEAIKWNALINRNEHFNAFVLERLLPLVGTSLNRVRLLKEFNEKDKENIINSFKCELLSLKSFSHLAESFYKYLPGLSVTAAFVVLRTDKSSSRFVGGFYGETLYRDEVEFDDDLLLPESISETLSGGTYVVSELFSENTDLGYIIIKTENNDGLLAEELRTSLSSAVQGMYLLESSNNARLRAEDAEKARSEFFSNVSEDLRDPLLKISSIITSIRDESLKKAIKREVDKAEHMLDLSLANTGELETEDKLINIDSALKETADKKGIEIQISGSIPLIYFDPEKLKEAVELVVNLSLDNGCPVKFKLSVEKDKVVLKIKNTKDRLDFRLFLNDASYLLAERIMVMHQDLIMPSLGSIRLIFSLPTFSLESAKEKEGRPLVFGIALNEDTLTSDDVKKNRRKLLDAEISSIHWDMRECSYETLSILRRISRESMFSRTPLYFYGTADGFVSPLAAIDYLFRAYDAPPVLILGAMPEELRPFLGEKNIIELDSIHDAGRSETAQRARTLITTERLKADEIIRFRHSSSANFNIIIMLPAFSKAYAESICSIPRLLLVNTCMASSDDFLTRFNAILAGEKILPAFTGSLVKKALGYLVEHATSQISRWQLAESVNVSEDYLTRIFRKELGVSPWDYLNRYRIYLASELLMQEALSVNEVAYRTGFQDQAYFCRVFKKIKGVSPGKMRSRS